ncbi:mismatch repair endonuclease PMS2 isoform X1 [Lepeophtheirus salmonis]|uniref:mismatch repair endonuclease PMS2 isoform X1 n=1 Tax=Lepeophtheirus salmonis TaxID=72036 RepID=UPI001AE6E4CA|nr:mismatch repair endonuclease PMS2-like isoform X1 [Lepeophtheirus salmonis]
MANITPLDKGSVHRICSGQVVLSLGIGVKELVENALDAGAKRVEVGFYESGWDKITVSDDGHGVEPQNYTGLALKHHTSKIRNFSDVAEVDTFGFRGEALSSLCALSKLTVITRTPDSKIGVELSYDNSGKLVSTKNISRDKGTTVILEDLFYSLPVRRAEFKKHVKREFTKMLNVLTSYALISTGLSLYCWNMVKGKRTTVLQTHGRSEIKETLKDVFGSKSIKSLEEVNGEEGMIKINGYISSVKHGEGRNASDRQFLYLNHRPADLNKIRRRINETYKSYNRHQYPFLFLNIVTNKQKVDINVTPDKRQIFLENENSLIDFILQTLNQLFEDIPSIFDVTPLNQTLFKINEEEFPQNEGLKRFLTNSDSDEPTKKQKIMNSFFSESVASNQEDVCLEVLHEKDQFEDKRSRLFNGIYDNEEEKSVKIVHQNDLSEDRRTRPFNEISDNEDEFFIKSNHKDQSSNSRVLSFFKKHNLDETEEEDFIQNVEGRSSNGRIEMSPGITKNYYSPNASFTSKKNFTTPLVENTSFIVEDISAISSNSKTHENASRNSRCDIIIDDSSYDPSLRRVVKVNFDIAKVKSLRKLSSDSARLSYRKFFAKICPEDNNSAEEELKKCIKKESFKSMKILGQFNLGFIICLLDFDIFIVDQHATDEKYNFETLQNTCRLEPQNMVIPQVLELTYANENILSENIDIFNENGFEFDFNEEANVGSHYKLKRVPMYRNWNFGKSDVEELIFMLTDFDRSCAKKLRPSKVRAMFASRSCRSSVMIGTALSYRDMRRLIDHMSEMEHPWNCPHGRPTMRHLVNLNMIR